MELFLEEFLVCKLAFFQTTPILHSHGMNRRQGRPRQTRSFATLKHSKWSQETYSMGVTLALCLCYQAAISLQLFLWMTLFTAALFMLHIQNLHTQNNQAA